MCLSTVRDKKRRSSILCPTYLEANQEKPKQKLGAVDRSVVVFVERRHDGGKLRRRQSNLEDPAQNVGCILSFEHGVHQTSRYSLAHTQKIAITLRSIIGFSRYNALWSADRHDSIQVWKCYKRETTSSVPCLTETAVLHSHVQVDRFMCDLLREKSLALQP